MENLKKNNTRYSGLNLQSLEFLVRTEAPVNAERKREVWIELLYRYFKEGREFNLYKLLKGNPIMFANTIGWELERKEVQIPAEHSADFMDNLLKFIDYVDRKVLQEGLEMEWQLHELEGLKGMVERVRDSKTKDINLRQKINLFIDKINRVRKETLVLIEEQKTQKNTQITADNALVIQQGDKEVVITNEKQALMKQELRHLAIPISKLKKAEWEEAMNELNLYYPEDQVKLLKLGLRKYSFRDYKKYSLQAFQLNLKEKIPHASMKALLFNGSYHNRMLETLFGSVENLYNQTKELYLSAEGATEEGWISFSNEFLQAYRGEFSSGKLTKRALEILEEIYPYIQKYKGADLSTLFEKKTKDILGDYVRTYDIKYDKERKNWRMDGQKFEAKELTVFELIFKALDYIRGYGREGHQIVNYSIENKAEVQMEISRKVPYHYHQMIRDFCQFPSTITFDENIPNYLKDKAVSSMLSSFSDSRKPILALLRIKFNADVITDDELRFLFKTQEGLNFFKRVTSGSRAMEGWLQNSYDFVGKVFDRILGLIDFSIQEERELFFRLPVRVRDYFDGYGKYLKKEHLDWVVEKLQREAPHELMLVTDYFSGINETYEEFEVYKRFEHMSNFERLLWEREGIQTGETKRHEGYKEGNTYYSSEEATHKFVYEYFQNVHKDEDNHYWF